MLADLLSVNLRTMESEAEEWSKLHWIVNLSFPPKKFRHVDLNRSIYYLTDDLIFGSPESVVGRHRVQASHHQKETLPGSSMA